MKKNEIKKKILVVKNIKRITKVVEMITFSKINKIRKKISNYSVYVKYLKNIIDNFYRIRTMRFHYYFFNKSIKRIAILFFSTDQNMVGNINNDICLKVLNKIKIFNKIKTEVILFIYGKKAYLFFKKNTEINVKSIFLINKIDKVKLNILSNKIINIYNSKKINRFYVINTSFNRKLKIFKVLPYTFNKKLGLLKLWDYIYEIEEIRALNMFFLRYLKYFLYKKYLQNSLNIQLYKVNIMKFASENSNKLIKNLNIDYNKARQTSVTQEISEIISSNK
ncbi:MAG: F0F1 ATP synthase subunit gamma [Enterobacteriaceae bacterium]